MSKIVIKDFNKPATQVYYMKGVNMNYSFKSLKDLALQMGANLLDGDILVCENARGDKRKAIKIVGDRDAILYTQLPKGFEYEALGKEGKVRKNSVKRRMLDCML